MESDLWQEKTGETPRKTYPTQFRPPRNPHGVTETRTRDPSGGKRGSKRLRHGAADCYHNDRIIDYYHCNRIIVFLQLYKIISF